MKIKKEVKNERKKLKPKCKRRNLISLVWSMNTCYSDLIVGIPKDVVIDTVAGTWTFRGETYKIGAEYYGRAITGNPIGIYDRTKIKHLNQMKEAIEEEVMKRSSNNC